MLLSCLTNDMRCVVCLKVCKILTICTNSEVTEILGWLVNMCLCCHSLGTSIWLKFKLKILLCFATNKIWQLELVVPGILRVIYHAIPIPHFYYNKRLLHDRPSGSEKYQPEGKNIAQGRRHQRKKLS